MALLDRLLLIASINYVFQWMQTQRGRWWELATVSLPLPRWLQESCLCSRWPIDSPSFPCPFLSALGLRTKNHRTNDPLGVQAGPGLRRLFLQSAWCSARPTQTLCPEPHGEAVLVLSSGLPVTHSVSQCVRMTPGEGTVSSTHLVTGLSFQAKAKDKALPPVETRPLSSPCCLPERCLQDGRVLGTN